MKQQFSAFAYKVVNQAEDAIDIHVDGIIVDAETQSIFKNWFGDETSTSYKSFRDQVTKANPKTINLFINSDGGMVNDAMAIHDFMVDLEGKGVIVNRKVRGLAASAATFLAMGKNSSMSENSWLMIHNVSGGVFGNVDAIERYATTTRKINDSIVKFYSAKTGIKEADIQDMMTKETWMSATEAKEKGFIDAIDNAASFTNSIKPEHWQFNNTAVLNSYNSSVGAKDDNHTFLHNLKSEAMKLIDNLTNAIKGAKDDKSSDKISNKADILALVEKVLTPFAAAIDEKIKDEESGTTTEEVVETADEKKIREDKEAADKKEKDSADASDAENKRVKALEKENADLKNSIALNRAKPENSNTPDVMKDIQVEYQQ